ncbi:hypothetical protein AB0D08_28580 [Kitasatospora sp. NPDC048540]|uniref:hypothetical protein n=1 Tax=unclassified Kitasatospora TaxID=2633591 RepID=UPI0018F699D2|nr:hypothetical protein [Kitasatospora sp. MBT63]
MPARPDSETAPSPLDRPQPMHPLVFHPEGEDVVVGRADTDTYVVLPVDGAYLVHLLAEGTPPNRAAAAYRERWGEDVDIQDLLDSLDELGFLLADGEHVAEARPVRHQRLGKALFGPAAWVCYAALTVLWLVESVRTPDLLPDYHHIFFTPYYSVIALFLLAGQTPLIALHEAFHALAGRRIGLHSHFRLGRRLYYVVAETSMDGLVAVPRRKRYLPILAGVLADVLALAALTLAADLLRRPDGSFPLAAGLCLALAYATVLRLAWQLLFYLRTDLYLLMTTVLGCVDLHTAAKHVLRDRIRRLTGRPRADDTHLHPTDLRVARWYSWLMVLGYTFTLLLGATAAVPMAYHVVVGVLGRFTGSTSVVELVDSVTVLALSGAQLAVAAAIALRDRRAARAAAAG